MLFAACRWSTATLLLESIWGSQSACCYCSRCSAWGHGLGGATQWGQNAAAAEICHLDMQWFMSLAGVRREDSSKKTCLRKLWKHLAVFIAPRRLSSLALFWAHRKQADASTLEDVSFPCSFCWTAQLNRRLQTKHIMSACKVTDESHCWGSVKSYFS